MRARLKPILILLSALIFVACGNNNENESDSSPKVAQEQSIRGAETPQALLNGVVKGINERDEEALANLIYYPSEEDEKLFRPIFIQSFQNMFQEEMTEDEMIRVDDEPTLTFYKDDEKLASAHQSNRTVIEHTLYRYRGDQLIEEEVVSMDATRHLGRWYIPLVE